MWSKNKAPPVRISNQKWVEMRNVHVEVVENIKNAMERIYKSLGLIELPVSKLSSIASAT